MGVIDMLITDDGGGKSEKKTLRFEVTSEGFSVCFLHYDGYYSFFSMKAEQ